MAFLSVSNIEKSFGGNKVLDGINMEIDKGKIYQMIGPNGCGKTTLINVISGLIKPDSGEINFDGTDIVKKGPYEICKLGLARTWQIPQPFVNLTAMENLMMAAPENTGESKL